MTCFNAREKATIFLFCCVTEEITSCIVIGWEQANLLLTFSLHCSCIVISWEQANLLSIFSLHCGAYQRVCVRDFLSDTKNE